MEATVLDFGCGLGRNGPLLGKFFQDVIGFDLPEMISRLIVEYPAFAAQTYRQNYSVVEEMVKKEKFCLLYDSVVLQHIVDRNYLSNLIDLICSVDSFRTLISIYNASTRPVHVTILEERGWRVWHTEVETLSFEGVPHVVAVFRR